MAANHTDDNEQSFWKSRHAYVQKRLHLEHAKYSAGRLTAVRTRRIKPEQALAVVYDLLTTLDSKAAALMQLNGVTLAAAALLLNAQGLNQNSGLSFQPGDTRLIVTIACLSALSVFLCLVVVNVSWQFLGKVTEEKDQFDYTKEFCSLQGVAERRQWYYRLAWVLSCFAALLFLLELAKQAMGVFGLWSPLVNKIPGGATACEWLLLCP